MASSGWVEERGNGRWRLNVNCGVDESGNRKVVRKTVDAKNKTDAKKQLKLLSAEIEKGQYIEPTKQTFADFIRKWIKDYADKNLSPKTLFRYKEMLESRVIPALGHLKVDQIKPLHLVEFYGNLTENGIRKDGKEGGLSPKTIQHHHRLLSKIFNDAVQWQLIASSPAARVTPPKVHKKHAAFYTVEQTLNLIKVAEKENIRNKLIIHLALGCGLRCGEVTGLEWQDMDFENSTLSVRQVGQYLPGVGSYTKQPKTDESTRTITVPASVMALFRQYKVSQAESKLKLGNLWYKSNRVFTLTNGKPVHPEFPSRWFPVFINKHKLPYITYHALRHTNATLMIATGAPMKYVSDRLGHSNISITNVVYGHTLKTVDKDIAYKLDDILTGSGKQVKQA